MASDDLKHHRTVVAALGGMHTAPTLVNKLAKVKEMLIAGSLPHDSAPGQPSTEGSTPPERAAKEILALQHS